MRSTPPRPPTWRAARSGGVHACRGSSAFSSTVGGRDAQRPACQRATPRGRVDHLEHDAGAVLQGPAVFVGRSFAIGERNECNRPWAAWISTTSSRRPPRAGRLRERLDGLGDLGAGELMRDRRSGNAIADRDTGSHSRSSAPAEPSARGIGTGPRSRAGGLTARVRSWIPATAPPSRMPRTIRAKSLTWRPPRCRGRTRRSGFGDHAGRLHHHRPSRRPHARRSGRNGSRSACRPRRAAGLPCTCIGDIHTRLNLQPTDPDRVEQGRHSRSPLRRLYDRARTTMVIVLQGDGVERRGVRRHRPTSGRDHVARRSSTPTSRPSPSTRSSRRCPTRSVARSSPSSPAGTTTRPASRSSSRSRSPRPLTTSGSCARRD